MATLEEDFTFPATTTDPPPRFIDSPPLWRCSTTPRPSPENSKGKEVDDEEKFVLRSFQEFKAKSLSKKDVISHDEEEEEKMDMLWQDLNDEFSRKSGKTAQNYDASSPGNDQVAINCVKALKLSKNNGHGKKPNILVFIKVLKKVFLLHNSHRTIKKRSW